MTTDNIDERAQARINAFRLASLQGPVLQGPPPIPSPTAPTFNFFYARLAPKDRLRVLKEIKEGVLLDWQTKWDAAIESMGLTKPPPVTRLAIYEGVFDDAHWAELKSKFPFEWQKTWNDYQRLLIQRAQGKLS